jgi:hypothetical protein
MSSPKVGGPVGQKLATHAWESCARLLGNQNSVGRPESVQSCTDRPCKRVQPPQRRNVATKASRVSNVRSQAVPAIRRRGPALGQPVHNRRRETDIDRSCVHLGASGVAERAHFRRQRQSAKSHVGPPPLAKLQGMASESVCRLAHEALKPLRMTAERSRPDAPLPVRSASGRRE